MYKAYVLGLCRGNIPTKYGQNYGTVPPFEDPESTSKSTISRWLINYNS